MKKGLSCMYLYSSFPPFVTLLTMAGFHKFASCKDHSPCTNNPPYRNVSLVQFISSHEDAERKIPFPLSSIRGLHFSLNCWSMTASISPLPGRIKQSNSIGYLSSVLFSLLFFHATPGSIRVCRFHRLQTFHRSSS